MKSASSVLEESLPRRRMRRSVAVRIRKQHERVIPVVTPPSSTRRFAWAAARDDGRSLSGTVRPRDVRIELDARCGGGGDARATAAVPVRVAVEPGGIACATLRASTRHQSNLHCTDPGDVRRHHETTGILGFVTHAHTCAVTRGDLNPLARGCLIRPDANCPRGHGCAPARTSNTGTVPQALTATVVRAPEHRARTSRTKSPAPCIGGPRFRGFPLAEVDECPRSDRRLDLHNRYPGFGSPPCPVPMRKVSSRPDTAPGGAPFPGRLHDRSETAGRDDPGGEIHSVRRRTNSHRYWRSVGRAKLCAVATLSAEATERTDPCDRRVSPRRYARLRSRRISKRFRSAFGRYRSSSAGLPVRRGLRRRITIHRQSPRRRKLSAHGESGHWPTTANGMEPGRPAPFMRSEIAGMATPVYPPRAVRHAVPGAVAGRDRRSCRDRAVTNSKSNFERGLPCRTNHRARHRWRRPSTAIAKAWLDAWRHRLQRSTISFRRLISKVYSRRLNQAEFDTDPAIAFRKMSYLLIAKARLHAFAALRANKEGNIHSLAVQMRPALECAGPVVSMFKDLFGKEPGAESRIGRYVNAGLLSDGYPAFERTDRSQRDPEANQRCDSDGDRGRFAKLRPSGNLKRSKTSSSVRNGMAI